MDIRNNMTTIKGMLEPFFETGTEGIIWSVIDEDDNGYESLHCLGRGDYLAIFDKADPANLVWYGNIDFEYERNKRPLPHNPGYSQQAVLGYWVHGLQKDVEPEQWGTWFSEYYPCELIKADLGRFYPVNSSIVSSYTFDGRRDYSGKEQHLSGDLFLQFKNGTIYKYKDVPAIVEEALINAESFGKFFAANIKDKFVTEKVEFPKPDWDYIPILSGGKFPKVKP
jgi:hypothetical protein